MVSHGGRTHGDNPQSGGHPARRRGGPFLFCLGLHPALVKLQEEFPDDLVSAFMDDIDGGLDETRVTGYVDRAEQLLAEKKLRLRRDKSVAWSPRWQQDSDIPADIAASGVKCSTEGITVLGCPLGGNSFIQHSLEKITRSHQPLLDAIVTFAHRAQAFFSAIVHPPG
ncbi:unnamed protein product [Vitrella brassicaformis CCMP3155]|uniref:Reverse transcriptase domain-containing protein n=1 Tax=Vitrella brassicaformis (strain CCMP3155) TaxID=1169540 RepID=A0A0G4F7J5_VITBC|nr:unnamed protein product [Vitrella brassicaformis CCMP3155]|eukprot:CEM07965.1 unnamed protein product [Vitrella brassicaformis CCMP3155]